MYRYQKVLSAVSGVNLAYLAVGAPYVRTEYFRYRNSVRSRTAAFGKSMEEGAERSRSNKSSAILRAYVLYNVQRTVSTT